MRFSAPRPYYKRSSYKSYKSAAVKSCRKLIKSKVHYKTSNKPLINVPAVLHVKPASGYTCLVVSEDGVNRLGGTFKSDNLKAMAKYVIKHRSDRTNFMFYDKDGVDAIMFDAVTALVTTGAVDKVGSKRMRDD